MNIHSPPPTADMLLTRTEIAGLVALAARTVSPLWPLESAIAVNPLSGFEERSFQGAVRQAGVLFDARESLPLSVWRKLLEDGRVEVRTLRDAAIRHLGGTFKAMANIAPGLMAIDCLMARLCEIETEASHSCRMPLAPDAAFIAKWCGAFFDRSIAATPMPNRKLGLYNCVLSLLRHDSDFERLTGDKGRQLLLTVPRDPYEAIAEGLAVCSGTRDSLEHLSSLVARLPGWAGHVRWRIEHADRDRVYEAPSSMADLLALWLLLERADAVCEIRLADHHIDVEQQLVEHFGIDPSELDPAQRKRLATIAEFDGGVLGSLFMTAMEWSYANAVVPQLERATKSKTAETLPDAQLVFCIDVRSEPFRRKVEQVGNYETFGYAGFFGLPIALRAIGADHRRRLLPVLLEPQHDLTEGKVEGRQDLADDAMRREDRDAAATGILDAAKFGTATAFTTAEATGPLAGLTMLARTIAPRLVDRRRRLMAMRKQAAFEPRLECASGSDCFNLAEKIGYASAMFRLTGMSPQTARFVVLAGHGGSAVNNPYATALDCGACGGHAGGSNARVLAAMLNDPEVRRGLAAQGLTVPNDTWFLAAEHNTTTDAVVIFDREKVPDGHRDELAMLERDLVEAGAANRASRAVLLDRTPEDLLTGAAHWGEVRPEWSLARNAAFVVGPRKLTKGVDLEGRAFLHSYDWQSDPTGEALTTILTAPMVVAQWINCQYLFSTIDNDRYGSGDKVTQNVLGGIGVVQGNGGDLMVGLPRQSLFNDAGEPYHLPQRLLTIVLAPLDRVETVVESNDILRRLFGKGWVQLVVIDPKTGKALRWQEDDDAAREGTTIHSTTC